MCIPKKNERFFLLKACNFFLPFLISCIITHNYTFEEKGSLLKSNVNSESYMFNNIVERDALDDLSGFSEPLKKKKGSVRYEAITNWVGLTRHHI